MSVQIGKCRRSLNTISEKLLTRDLKSWFDRCIHEHISFFFFFKNGFSLYIGFWTWQDEPNWKCKDDCCKNDNKTEEKLLKETWRTNVRGRQITHEVWVSMTVWEIFRSNMTKVTEEEDDAIYWRQRGKNKENVNCEFMWREEEFHMTLDVRKDESWSIFGQ